jgi:signal peptidase I
LIDFNIQKALQSLKSKLPQKAPPKPREPKYGLADIPALTELEGELKHEQYKRRRSSVLRSTVGVLLVVAAIAILIATLMLPVLHIYGSSMTPTLTEGDLVISLKGSNWKQGDIIAFYNNNKVLIKRVIATSGDWVDIKEDGTVLVNGEAIDEPYLVDKAKGDCDINFPYQVPDSRVFVMGDHRSISVDSRSKTIGCVAEEQVVGRLAIRIWPLSRFGKIEAK